MELTTLCIHFLDSMGFRVLTPYNAVNLFGRIGEKVLPLFFSMNLIKRDVWVFK